MANAIMDIVLMGLLLAALWFGVRLDKRLKALRAAHEGFAKAVQELDQAAIRAHHSLKELRHDADESQDLLHGRILAARELMQKLDSQVVRAERAGKEMETQVNTLAAVQGRAEQTAKRLETVARPEAVRPEPVRETRAQPRLEDDADYNPAWAAPPKTTAVPAKAASARDPFERDLIRFSGAPSAANGPTGGQARRSLLPDVAVEDESEIMDKVQMSELVVANLNEMIRSLTMPTRQVMSVEDDLFGGDEAPATRKR